MRVRLVTADGVEDRTAEELPALLDGEEGLVWVDIPACDGEAAHALSEVFGFHPMAVRECVERHRVPKMRAYPDHVFVVLHTPERDERGHVHNVELDQFVGRNYLVTVHGPVNPAVAPEAPLRETGAVLRRLRGGRLRPTSPRELSHAIVTAMIRSQEQYVETVTKEVWRLEQRVTGGQVGDPEEFLTELFRARHGLLAVRTMGALGTAIYGRLGALTGISAPGRRLVADAAGQLERVRGMAGDLLRPHVRRHGVRHELRPHAGAALGRGLSVRPGPDAARLGRALPDVQAPRLALISRRARPPPPGRGGSGPGPGACGTPGSRCGRRTARCPPPPGRLRRRPRRPRPAPAPSRRPAAASPPCSPGPPPCPGRRPRRWPSRWPGSSASGTTSPETRGAAAGSR